MATSDGSLGIRYDKRARNISENIVLETKTQFTFFAVASCVCFRTATLVTSLSGTEVHKFHRSDMATSSKETKTEKINNLLP